jgi:hypothetical protein
VPPSFRAAARLRMSRSVPLLSAGTAGSSRMVNSSPKNAIHAEPLHTDSHVVNACLGSASRPEFCARRPTTPTRARRLVDASVDQTGACNASSLSALPAAGQLSMPGFVLKPLADADNDRVCGIVAESCSGNPVISPNVTCVVRDLPGYVADEEGTRVGLAQHRIAPGDCEIITLASLRSGRGFGNWLASHGNSQALRRRAARSAARCR